MMYFPHVREQMQQMEEVKSLPADSRVRRRVYCYLTLLLNQFKFSWQNQGAMDELYKYSEIVMKVLEEDLEDQEDFSVLAMVTLIEVQATAVQFISCDITFEEFILRYLLKQMTPLAKIALEKARNSQNSNDTSDGRTQMSLPRKDDVMQDGPLTLHTLTRALTQTFDSEALVTETSIQVGKEATRGSKSINSSTEESQKAPESSDGLGKNNSSHTGSLDPLPASQEPGLDTPARPPSSTADEKTIERNEIVDAISPSRRELITDSLSFAPKYLSDVFLSVTPPVRVPCLLSFLSILIKVYYNYFRVAEADLLTIYSTLPVDSAEQPDYASLQASQLLIEASRLAAMEDLDGTLSVFLKIISTSDSSATIMYVILDYTIIMNKLDRPAETERIIDQIFYNKPAALPIDPINLDRCLARDQQNTYIWLKKSLSTSQRLQGRVDQSLQTLLTTLETAQAVFGVNSLSYLHAVFLLGHFYRCNFPQSLSTLESEREEKKYSEMFVSTLEGQYCSNKSGNGGKQMCNVEGLQMGIVLWVEGALEETVAVFEAFAEMSGKIMGEDDILTKKARRGATLAKEEWEIGKKERKEDILRFGTVIFPRKMEDLAQLLEDKNSA